MTKQNTSVVALKIVNYLVSEYNYKPIKVIGTDEFYFLENADSKNYHIIAVSLKGNVAPSEQLSENHANIIINIFKTERSVRSPKFAIFAFGDKKDTYHGNTFDVFTCADKEVPEQVSKMFPKISDFVIDLGKDAPLPSESVALKREINTTIKKQLIEQSIGESRFIAELVKSTGPQLTMIIGILLGLGFVSQSVFAYLYSSAGDATQAVVIGAE